MNKLLFSVSVLSALIFSSCQSNKVDETPTEKKVVKISVKGNRLIDEQGQPMVYKGLALNDPSVLTDENEWNENHFNHIKNWGATVVRIPVAPKNWQKRGKEFYF